MKSASEWVKYPAFQIDQTPEDEVLVYLIKLIQADVLRYCSSIVRATNPEAQRGFGEEAGELEKV